MYRDAIFRLPFLLMAPFLMLCTSSWGQEVHLEMLNDSTGILQYESKLFIVQQASAHLNQIGFSDHFSINPKHKALLVAHKEGDKTRLSLYSCETIPIHLIGEELWNGVVSDVLSANSTSGYFCVVALNAKAEQKSKAWLLRTMDQKDAKGEGSVFVKSALPGVSDVASLIPTGMLCFSQDVEDQCAGTVWLLNKSTQLYPELKTSARADALPQAFIVFDKSHLLFSQTVIMRWRSAPDAREFRQPLAFREGKVFVEASFGSQPDHDYYFIDAQNKKQQPSPFEEGRVVCLSDHLDEAIVYSSTTDDATTKAARATNEVTGEYHADLSFANGKNIQIASFPKDTNLGGAFWPGFAVITDGKTKLWYASESGKVWQNDIVYDVR